MARSPYAVEVHNKTSSIGSDYSRSSAGSSLTSSANSTPRSLSPGDYEFRDAQAADYHTAVHVSNAPVTIYNHHKVNFDPNEPSPTYRSR